MAQQGKEEAEDIRSSQQRFRHTEKSCMPMAYGKGEAVVEIGEMEGVDEKVGSRSSNLASVPRSVVSAAPKKKTMCELPGRFWLRLAEWMGPLRVET